MTDSPSAPAHTQLENDANPEALDRVVDTTNPRLWVALVAALVLVALGVTWVFVASVPLTASAIGMVSEQDGRVIIPAPIDGAVSLLISPQEHVTKGQTVARIAPFAGGSAIDLTAPVDGAVASILVREGAGVITGQSVLTVSVTDHNPQVTFIGYATSSAVSHFRAGDPVTVNVGSTAQAISASMPGHVVAVATVPASTGDLQTSYMPQEVTDNLLSESGGVIYQIVVAADANTDAGSLNNGQMVTFDCVYGDIRPIDIILGNQE